MDRARHARPPPQLSPPSRETVSNPRPTSHHLSQNGIEEFSLPTRNPAFNPAYLPVPLSRDPALASVNIEQEQGRPTSASLLLEDSLEVPVLSSSQVDSRPNSSLGLRRSIGNNSTGITINQSINQSIKQWVSQSINQSVNHSISQGINQKLVNQSVN